MPSKGSDPFCHGLLAVRSVVHLRTAFIRKPRTGVPAGERSGPDTWPVARVFRRRFLTAGATTPYAHACRRPSDRSHGPRHTSSFPRRESLLQPSAGPPHSSRIRPAVASPRLPLEPSFPLRGASRPYTSLSPAGRFRARRAKREVRPRTFRPVQSRSSERSGPVG